MYVQPGYETKPVEVQSARPYVSPTVLAGNAIQPGTESRAVEVQQGRPHVSAATGGNYQQPNIGNNVPEVQTAKPFAAIATASHSPYVQPHDHRPKEVHHDRLSVSNPVIPFYQQGGTGTGPFPQTIDPGKITMPCPVDSLISVHIGSSQYFYACPNGHYFGPDANGFVRVISFGGIIPGRLVPRTYKRNHRLTMDERQIELEGTGETLTLDSDGGLSDNSDSSFESVGDGIFLRLTTTGETQMLAVENGSATVLSRW